MKNAMITLVCFLCASQALAAENAHTEVCGTLQDIILEPTNPPAGQVQITLLNEKKIRVRSDLAQALSERADTIQLLMKALDNPKYKICLNNHVSEKGYHTMGLLKK